MRRVFDKLGDFIPTGVIKEFFRQPIFRTMGRLTFGAYLIHPAVLRVSYGYLRQPVYGTDMKIVNSPTNQLTVVTILIMRFPT